MSKEKNPMEKLNFLIGNWHLKYNIPESNFHTKDSAKGTGEFKKILKKRYIIFDYSVILSSAKSSAHAVFSWDNQLKIYRYWWFEDSGNFMTAVCNLTDDATLHFNWHNSLLIQTIKKVNDDSLILQMKYPENESNNKIILEVLFRRKKI